MIDIRLSSVSVFCDHVILSGSFHPAKHGIQRDFVDVMKILHRGYFTL